MPLGCVLISAEPQTICYAVRFPAEELLRLFLKKINKGFVLNQQHKQLYLTTLRS